MDCPTASVFLMHIKFVHHELAGRGDQRREGEFCYRCPQKIRYWFTCSITCLSSLKRYLNRHVDERNCFAVEYIQVIAEVQLFNRFYNWTFTYFGNHHVFRKPGIKVAELNHFLIHPIKTDNAGIKWCYRLGRIHPRLFLRQPHFK